MALYTRILLGLVAGALTGIAANVLGLGWLQQAFAALEPLGTAFIRLVTMVVVPLVVASMLVGTASLGDLRRLGRIGGRTMGYYLATTAAAVTLGIVIANIVQPGSRIDPATRDQLSAEFGAEAATRVRTLDEAPSLGDVLVGLIPRNPVQAAAEFDMLPLIVFSLIFGAALGTLADGRRRAVVDFFDGINETCMIVIGWIMQLAPYAVFVLIGTVVSRFGLDLLRSLLVYALVVAAALVIHTFGTLALLVRVLARRSPLDFFRRIAPVGLMAFSTSSSNATLPVTMKTAEEQLGVTKEISSFALPLGATINMDGTALYQAVATVFIAQVYGVPLDLAAQLTIVLTATLASIGSAGVPSAGLVMLIVVLNSVGLGQHAATGIALILGVDRILDMMRTVVNVTGDLVCAVYLMRVEKGVRAAADRPAPV
ncbi:MAG TPA: dicarboxylate/amino acid:cation symporter [Vicinamibacterales bacterium]|nr:dicarboxylate/amino acid:cation symporter [Vicinamibacterales bacterium]